VLASAADRAYGRQLLNLIGSVKANSDLFDRIVVYDLGLTWLQRRLLERVDGVEVRVVPPFVPHWAQCWTWKPWIWTHTEAERLVFLDAGITVLRSLADPLAQISERGYFVVGSGHPNREHIPSDYYELYGIPSWLADRDCIVAGVIGFAAGSPFFGDVVEPTFRDVELGRNLGWSASEASWRNLGVNRLENPIIRDAERFRHDQTLLNIHFYKSVAQPWVNDAQQYGGSRSPYEHPEQLIWCHRRRAAFPYLATLPYSTPSASLAGRAWGLTLQARSWLGVNGRDPRAYLSRGAATIRRRTRHVGTGGA
jgi:hypothetical protein